MSRNPALIDLHQDWDPVFDEDFYSPESDQRRAQDFRSGNVPAPVQSTYQNVNPGYLQWDQQAFRPTARDLGAVSQPGAPTIPRQRAPGATVDQQPRMVDAGNANPIGYGYPISNAASAGSADAEYLHGVFDTFDASQQRVAALDIPGTRENARTAYDNAVAAGLDMPAWKTPTPTAEQTRNVQQASESYQAAAARTRALEQEFGINNGAAPVAASAGQPATPTAEQTRNVQQASESYQAAAARTRALEQEFGINNDAAPVAASAGARPSTRSDSWVGAGTPRPGAGFSAPPPGTFAGPAATGNEIAGTVAPPDFGNAVPARGTNNPNATAVGRSANDPDRMLERAARGSRNSPMQQAQIAGMIRAPQDRAQEREQTRQWQVEDRGVARQNQIEDRTQGRDWTIEDRDLGHQRRGDEIQQQREWQVEGREMDPQPVSLPDGTQIYRDQSGRTVHTQNPPRGPVESMPIPHTDYFLPHQDGRPVGGPLPSPARNAPPEFNIVTDPDSGVSIFTYGGKVIPSSSLSVKVGEGQWEPLEGRSTRPQFQRLRDANDNESLYLVDPKTGALSAAQIRMAPPTGATSATGTPGSEDPGEAWMRAERERRSAAATR